MNTKPNSDATGTFVFSDDALDEMQNLEATEVMEALEEAPIDYDATVVLDESDETQSTKRED